MWLQLTTTTLRAPARRPNAPQHTHTHTHTPYRDIQFENVQQIHGTRPSTAHTDETQQCVQVVYTEFHPYRSRRAEMAGVNSLMLLSTTVTPPTATLDNHSCKTPIPDYMKPIRRIQSLEIRHRRTDVVSPHAAPLYFKPNGQHCQAHCTITDRHKVHRYIAPITGQTNNHWTVPDSSIRHVTAGHEKHSERTVQSPPAPRTLLLLLQPVICRPNLFSYTNKRLHVSSDENGLV